MAKNVDSYYVDDVPGWFVALFLVVIITCCVGMFRSCSSMAEESKKERCTDEYDTIECRARQEQKRELRQEIKVLQEKLNRV